MTMKYTTKIPFHKVGGFKVGHAQDTEALTGCTVLLFDKETPAGVDIRGGGPASRETPLLDPLANCKGLNALLLAGGSAFGLDAAGGVMKYLEERDIGYDVFVTKVPLVCTSCVFDLGIGRFDVRPTIEMAYQACEAATDGPVPVGNVGVGTGCTIGKLRGMSRAMKSGVGHFALQAGDLKIGAIVAVNALGNVYDIDDGHPMAGLRTPDGKSLCSTEDEMLRDVSWSFQYKNSNTTIGAIITNAAFDKSSLCKIAGMAHNGYARTIRPVHTMADGDAIYAFSTGDVKADINVVGTLAAYTIGKAVNCAIRNARGIGDCPSMRDLEE